MAKYYNIKVNLSEEDLFELQSGKEFNWNWNTEEDDNVIVKIHLFQGEEREDNIEKILRERDEAIDRINKKTLNTKGQ